MGLTTGEKADRTRMKNKIRDLELKLQALKELCDKNEGNLKRKLAGEKAAKTRMKNDIKKLESEIKEITRELQASKERVKELEGKAGEPSSTS